nr:MAG TPA: protein of unknown function (DUF5072) [Caudoviricetes sp.]
MTKAAALHSFFSSFGLTAYQENAVPDEATFPYITYTVTTDTFPAGEVALSMSLWYRSPSWTAINAKTEQISTAIGYGGRVVDCDSGKIWVKRGQPFANSMGDNTDSLIKRKLINISAEYLTFN